MKLIILFFTLVFSTSVFAGQKIITGTEAKKLMAALAGAGFPVENVDTQWALLRAPLKVQSGEFTCIFTNQFPDQWMSDVRCTKGSGPNGELIQNSLALAQAIAPHLQAYEVDSKKTEISPNEVSCELDYTQKKYRCFINWWS